jgi:hypothetical protein
LVLSTLNLTLETILRRWKVGGPPLLLPIEVRGSPLPPFSCLSLGNFEKRGMLEPSTTRALCPLYLQNDQA